MKIEVLADADAVASKAAAIVAAEARDAVVARGCFIMAVSGGHTPWQMLRALAGEKVPWGLRGLGGCLLKFFKSLEEKPCLLI